MLAVFFLYKIKQIYYIYKVDKNIVANKQQTPIGDLIHE